MITPFDIYLIGAMDNIGDTFGVIVMLSILCIVVSIVCGVFAKSEDNESLLKLSKSIAQKSFVVLVCAMIVSTILPSSKTLVAMYVIPPVLKSVQDNKQIQQIPQAVLDLIKSYESKDDDKK